MSDPMAAVNTLKRANDAFYGLRGSVGSLSHAVEILGAESVLRQLAQSTAAADAPERPAQRALIRHAAVTAQIAHRLANDHWLHEDDGRFTPGIVATTGLLHNLGRLALSYSLPMESDSLYGFSNNPLPVHGPIQELEQLQFGIDHAELGSFMLQHLHFPSEMVEAVRSHRCGVPTTSPRHPSRLSWITGAACLLAESAGYGLSNQVSFHHADLDAAFTIYDREVSLRRGDLEEVRRELSHSPPPDYLAMDDDEHTHRKDRDAVASARTKTATIRPRTSTHHPSRN